MKAIYNRVILKLSGEVFAGGKGLGIDYDTVLSIASYIKKMTEEGVQVGIVIGGGNFWRGRTSMSMDRATADYMGMMATVMNSLTMNDALSNIGVDSVVMSSLDISQITLRYNKNEAIRHLNEGKVTIFAGGTGSPFFSTDTAAALRAAEINADIILLAKNVDGVYDSDPNINPDAIKFDHLTFTEMLEKKLAVMDYTASTLCMENKIAIQVFDLNQPENILKALSGEKIGTTIKED